MTRKTKTTGWIEPHRHRFQKALTAQGYTVGSLRTYDGAARLLCRQVERRGIAKGQLTGATLAKARAGALADMNQKSLDHRRYSKYCIDRFIDALVEVGVAERPKPKARKSTPIERLHAEYESYLREQRGLADTSIQQCLWFLNRFIKFRFGNRLGSLDAVTPKDITDFMRKLRSGSAPRDKTPPSHLRTLFRFLFWSGKTKRDLVASIPRMAAPPKSTMPRYLKPEEIDKLVDATWAETPVGRRNYAMFMVLARLGLRAPEVIAIRLDDIDWRNSTILIRGKGKRHDRMPLPGDVGAAIVDYIKNGRRGTSRTLFVSSKPPHKPFTGGAVLNEFLIQAFEATGIVPPQKHIGSHLFRHSLATNLLRKGASFDEIGDVLRHRARATTMIYARHDIDALRSLAPAWPSEIRAARASKEARA